MKLLYGRSLAKKIKQQVKTTIAKLGQKPGLAVLLVGQNPASKIYVNLKMKACQEVGINFFLHRLKSNTSAKKIIALIDKLNNDKKVNGILVQLPLPNKLPTNQIIKAINPEKDPDCFHPKSLKKIEHNQEKIFPPTPRAILSVLKMAKIKLASKKVAIISNSRVFALPIMVKLAQEKARIDLIKPSLKNMGSRTKKADIIISAIGKKGMLTANMIKKGAVVIDVGCHKQGQKTYGDVGPEVAKKAALLSPVPGGVGPLTVAYLLKNVLDLAKLQK